MKSLRKKSMTTAEKQLKGRGQRVSLGWRRDVQKACVKCKARKEMASKRVGVADLV